MALTADYEYDTRGKTDTNKVLAGAADTLYKGAIVSAGTDGYIKVAADVANEVPLGLCREQVVAAGSNAEEVEIESGRVRVAKRTQHKLTVHCEDDVGASNAKYNSKYFVLYSGSTGYYFWFNVAAGGVDPAPAGFTLGGVIAVTAINTAAEIAALVHTAVEAAGAGGSATFAASVGTHIVTVVVQLRSKTTAPTDGNAGLVITTASTYLSGAQQSDIGELFYAIADDGVVYPGEASSANVSFGLCVGTDGEDHLWIDTRIKGV